MKNQPPFLRGYKLLKIPIVNQNGESAWPQLFPSERIEELRQTVGPRHFESQMMLNPMPLGRARLDAAALRFYDQDFDIRAAKLGETAIITGIALYWDPSTAHRHTDASVCVFILRDDKNKRIFIHDCLYMETEDYDPQPLTTQCNTILDFMEHRDIANIGIEVNGLGNALPEILRREANARNLTINVQRIVNRENKEKRILDALEPLLGTGRLFARECIRNTNLIDELNDWTPTGFLHDDGVDALAGAIQMQPIPVRPRGSKAHAIRAKTEFSI